MEYKNQLFEEADLLYLQAKEAYEAGLTEDGQDYQNRFEMLLEKLIRFGWDKEYMGI